VVPHCVLFVHGVGEQTPLAPDAFFTRIRRACQRELLRRGGGETQDHALVFEHAYWADITQPDQDALRRRLDVRGRIRRFLIGHMGDVVAYSKLPYPPDKYGEIHERFARSITRLSHAVQRAGSPWARVTVIAHSLGTVIAFDGMYNLQQAGTFPANLRFTNLFTLGSPIALFGLRYGLDRFTKPLRPKVWVNFSYPQDIIGYHLKPLNDAYAEAVTGEVVLLPSESANPFLGVVRMFTARVPGVGAMLAHSWYFTDPHVIGRIARTIAEQITELSCKSG
jgi:hypothetical protein